ncbi:ABC transporter permease subunit [Brucella abortus]|nr:ABC transporter permease subunit [Brucella abortus]
MISIPLGIRKAIKDGSRFDTWTSAVIIIGYAIPSFLFAILLIVVFAGGSFFDWFPLRGLTSPDFAQMTWFEKIKDYLWHMVLPVTALVAFRPLQRRHFSPRIRFWKKSASNM